MSQLQKRISSAVLMVAVAVAAVLMGHAAFTLLVAGIVAVLCWEWARMTGLEGNMRAIVNLYGCSLVATCAAWHPEPVVIAIAAIVTAGGGLAIMTYARGSAMAALGPLYLGMAGCALVWLNGDAQFGALATLFVFTVVWSTDTFAMVTGKAVGGPLLMPRISPNKTWAGAIGGLVCASACAALFVALWVPDGRWSYGMLVGSVLSLAAQAGDFGESAIKRAYGVKDTSRLIPGHGGVLDRLDGLIGAALAGLVLALAVNSSAPGRALLMGG